MIVCGRDLQFLSVIPNTPNWFIAIWACLVLKYFISVGGAARTHYDCTAFIVWGKHVIKVKYRSTKKRMSNSIPICVSFDTPTSAHSRRQCEIFEIPNITQLPWSWALKGAINQGNSWKYINIFQSPLAEVVDWKVKANCFG